jgi:hypothetical protein
MVNMAGVVEQLRKEHDRLSKELKGIAAALSAFGGAYGKRKGTRTISAEGRARISAAQKARWKKISGKGGHSVKALSIPKRRTMSAAARRKIAAAQRSRWAKVKAAKKG